MIDTSYVHHIQRLMVMGLFTLLLGARPYDAHRWHLSMAASGSYINIISNYRADCISDPKESVREKVCPFCEEFAVNENR